MTDAVKKMILHGWRYARQQQSPTACIVVDGMLIPAAMGSFTSAGFAIGALASEDANISAVIKREDLPRILVEREIVQYRLEETDVSKNAAIKDIQYVISSPLITLVLDIRASLQQSDRTQTVRR
jgi:hypothetical protein